MDEAFVKYLCQIPNPFAPIFPLWPILTGSPHYAAKSVGMILWAVKTWYACLVAEGYLMHNPFDALEPVKLPKRIPRDIPEEKDLISALNTLSRFWEEENIPNR
ncbi:MAG: hypothetical protein P1R74_11775 [Sedimenticola sp.]|nr:hypothetical protein [Sedimenticola sp.]